MVNLCKNYVAQITTYHLKQVVKNCVYTLLSYMFSNVSFNYMCLLFSSRS